MLAAVLAAAGCGRSAPANPLQGEWAVRMESAGAGSVPGPAEGRLVFPAGLGCYCDEVSQPPAGAVFGRGYVALEGAGPAPAFRTGPFSDRAEEVMAVPGADGALRMQLAPGMSGTEFRGVVAGDSARGTWAAVSHGDTLRNGSFVMWRVPRSTYTDSARARARRGLRAWRTGGSADVLDGPTDTLPPVEPLRKE